MTEHQHHVEEIDGLPLVILSKADVDHDHHMEEVTGLKDILDSKIDRRELNGYASDTHTHTAKGIANLPEILAEKADKQHTHSIPEIFEHAHHLDSKLSSSLMAYLRQAFTPSLKGSVICSNKKVALVVNFLSTYGYSMSTVSIKFRYRLTTSNNWISCPLVPFTETVLRYAIELDVMPGSYVFDALLIDVHNPDLKSMSSSVGFVIV